MKKILFAAGLLAAAIFTAVPAQGSDFITSVRNQHRALDAGNWHNATQQTLNMINQTNDSNVTAANFLQLGCLLWISGNRTKAISSLKHTVKVIGCSDDPDIAMAKIAQKIRSRIEKNHRGPSASERQALVKYIKTLSTAGAITVSAMEAADDNARHAALMAMYDSEIRRLKNESRRIERNAKYQARSDYRSATGKEFDPANRPSGGFAREQWDAAKRVYNIFD